MIDVDESEEETRKRETQFKAIVLFVQLAMHITTAKTKGHAYHKKKVHKTTELN